MVYVHSLFVERVRKALAGVAVVGMARPLELHIVVDGPAAGSHTEAGVVHSVEHFASAEADKGHSFVQVSETWACTDLVGNLG